MTPMEPTPWRKEPAGRPPCDQWFCATLCVVDAPACPEVEQLLQQAAAFASRGSVARQAGDEIAAEPCFRGALALAIKAADRIHEADTPAARGRVRRAAACLALNCGEVAVARGFIGAGRVDESPAEQEAWAQLRDIEAWPDAWLIAAVRCEPPDAAALETLAHRYWRPLFGRCELLALQRQKAGDLAQEAWRKVLRSRAALKPGGNFPAYLNTVATNIWRDWHRAARRAGAMAEDRLASLNGEIFTDDGGTIVLGDVIPDLKSLDAEAQRLLMLDIDHALGRLEPHLREALVARFLNEETCAEIGRRHGRTEQTISAWVREAVRQMKRHLEDSRGSGPRKEPT